MSEARPQGSSRGGSGTARRRLKSNGAPGPAGPGSSLAVNVDGDGVFDGLNDWQQPPQPPQQQAALCVHVAGGYPEAHEVDSGSDDDADAGAAQEQEQQQQGQEEQFQAQEQAAQPEVEEEEQLALSPQPEVEEEEQLALSLHAHSDPPGSSPLHACSSPFHRASPSRSDWPVPPVHSDRSVPPGLGNSLVDPGWRGGSRAPAIASWSTAGHMRPEQCPLPCSSPRKAQAQTQAGAHVRGGPCVPDQAQGRTQVQAQGKRRERLLHCLGPPHAEAEPQGCSTHIRWTDEGGVVSGDGSHLQAAPLDDHTERRHRGGARGHEEHESRPQAGPPDDHAEYRYRGGARGHEEDGDSGAGPPGPRTRPPASGGGATGMASDDARPKLGPGQGGAQGPRGSGGCVRRGLGGGRGRRASTRLCGRSSSGGRMGKWRWPGCHSGQRGCAWTSAWMARLALAARSPAHTPWALPPRTPRGVMRVRVRV